MGLLRPRKNKKFKYQPHYFDDKGDGNPFHIEHKFDKFRTTIGTNKGLKSKISVAWNEFRSSTNKKSNKRVLIIIAVLLLVFLFIIEFDLSIFLNR